MYCLLSISTSIEVGFTLLHSKAFLF